MKSYRYQNVKPKISYLPAPLVPLRLNPSNGKVVPATGGAAGEAMSAAMKIRNAIRHRLGIR